MIPDAAELAQIVARHFAGSHVEGSVVETGLAGLRIACAVANEETTSVTLHFVLTGAGFESKPVRAHYLAVGTTPQNAAAAGVALWCHGHAVALKAAAGETGLVPCYDLESRSYMFRVHAGTSQRAFGEAPNIDLVERVRAANARLGAPGALTRAVIESGRLDLPRDRWSAVSVMLGERAGSRSVEVRVDGDAVPNMDSVFAEPAYEPPGASLVLHEFSIVVPTGPALQGPTVFRRRPS